jgi:hypothetical protein
VATEPAWLNDTCLLEGVEAILDRTLLAGEATGHTGAFETASKTEQLDEEVCKAAPVVLPGLLSSLPNSFSVGRKLGCQKMGKIIDTQGDARSSFLTGPTFLGAVRRWDFLPSGPF